MRKLIYVFLLFFCIHSNLLIAQETDSRTEELEKLFIGEKYDDIIAKYSKDFENLEAGSLFYISYAHSIKENYEKALSLVNLALEKEDNSASHFLKGTILKNIHRPLEAITSFQKSIELDPNDLYAYNEISQTYVDMGKFDLAVNIAQEALKHVDKGSDEDLMYNYNLGLFESLQGNFEKSIPYFEYVIQMNPKDYDAQSKLIQSYYHLEEYDKAEPFKKNFYKAFADSLLVGTEQEDMFCVEQFNITGKKILAFERYEDGKSSKIYNKHCFYILKPDGTIDFRVQSEYSPFAKNGEMLYYLCASYSVTSRYNSGIVYTNDYSYQKVSRDAKKLIEEILTKRTK
ncbi:tetratricopeptide repeat protein [Sphingobacterium daejeonense]|uniref:Tetratricopeptide repeat protein n=1 Tax=Sphingobacterium daejeonense TaxID=371142 RepID=A0ABW3RN14_9SPHI